MLGYTDERWEELLECAAGLAPRRAVHDIVLEYFLREGFVDAARCFQEESSARSGEDLAQVAQRNVIRRAVLAGDIDGTVARVAATVSPEFLRQRPRLLFKLKKLQLVAAIRRGAVKEAIEIAQTQMAPLVRAADRGDAGDHAEEGEGGEDGEGGDGSTLRQELEQALSLLIFEDMEVSPMAHLLKPDEVEETARMLNEAILEFQGRESTPRLMGLLQEAQFYQDRLQAEGVDFPLVLRTGEP